MGFSTKSSKATLLVLGFIALAAVLMLTPKNQRLIDAIDTVEFDEQALLERAYEDVRNAEELPPLDEELIIKIFDEDNNLIQSMTLLTGDDIADDDFRKLINQSTLLAEYRTSKIYRLAR